MHLPARNEISAEYKWRLEDIYPSDERWEQDFRRVEEMINTVGSYNGRLGESAQVMLEAFRTQEQVEQINEKVYTYAKMRRDEDNGNHIYQALSDRAESLDARLQAANAYLVPEILSLPAETLERFRREEPGLELYKFALEEIFRQKPHRLSAAEEQLIARAEEVTQAPANIFKMMNNADLTFPAIKDEQDEEVQVTHGRFIQLLESGDRRVRRDAFQSVYSAYRGLINTLSTTLSASVKKDVFYARVRKYPSALEASLFADNVPAEVYDSLVQTVRRNLGRMHRYLELRKKLLGLEALHFYDLYTPLVKDVQWNIPYAQAVELVKQGLSPLGADYMATMTKGLDNGWVDVYENKGKTSGAYSWGPYGVHPYILLNYRDNLHNVFTLAHEMGHAMHSFYAFGAQPYTYAHYKIFTAEVASTVNEQLLMDHLLKTVAGREKRLYLLNHYLEQYRGTVFRQTMFAEFEMIIHQKAESGEALTPSLLNDIYRQLNADYYGPGIVMDGEIALEWARIPHFYSAFYVYKYATGFSAAAALTKQIIEQGGPAVDRYLGFLKSGGSDYPLRLLKAAGVDMTTPRPVQAGLDHFAELLDQIEALLG
ncbi:MAG: oligoendopeptidase F [Firmicutes bacterium]|nr:oligoendopeptidase F [Bacillota bacterium]